MRAGSLKHKIYFVEYNQFPDGHGGSIPQEKLAYRTQANVRPLGMNRTLQANQEILTGGYEIRFRWTPCNEPKKTWDCRYKDKLLTISSIQQVEEDRRMWLVIAMDKK